MKILVGCKRVIDYAVKIRVRADGSGVETANVKHSMNPFDEIAAEEALRIAERIPGSEVVAVSVGGDSAVDVLKTALAMGAHRAIHVETGSPSDSFSSTPSKLVASVLAKLVTLKEPSTKLIILGKQAIDNDSGQTGPMTAGLLGWPQAIAVSKISPLLSSSSDSLEATREVDWGLETVKVSLPALLTTDLRLNQPRYATLPNIIKAKSKPLDKISLKELGIEPSAIEGISKLLNVQEPPKRTGGLILGSVDELLDRLRNEAKII